MSIVSLLIYVIHTVRDRNCIQIHCLYFSDIGEIKMRFKKIESPLENARNVPHLKPWISINTKKKRSEISENTIENSEIQLIKWNVTTYTVITILMSFSLLYTLKQTDRKIVGHSHPTFRWWNNKVYQSKPAVGGK